MDSKALSIHDSSPEQPWITEMVQRCERLGLSLRQFPQLPEVIDVHPEAADVLQEAVDVLQETADFPQEAVDVRPVTVVLRPEVIDLSAQVVDLRPEVENDLDSVSTLAVAADLFYRTTDNLLRVGDDLPVVTNGLLDFPEVFNDPDYTDSVDYEHTRTYTTYHLRYMTSNVWLRVLIVVFCPSQTQSTLLSHVGITFRTLLIILVMSF